MLAVLIAAVLLLTACNQAPASKSTPPRPKPAISKRAYNDAFWAHWGDGKAELNGYDLTFRRYGQLRRGRAVAIFVTETFSNSLRVKSDPGRRLPADEFPVIKLNLIKKYQTGIYDYSEMTSAFVEPGGLPSKISFSSQEWCGHVYSQVLFQPPTALVTSHSYFDGEADSQRQLEAPDEAFSEDALYLWARHMAMPHMMAGTKRVDRHLLSLETARAKHIALGWEALVLESRSRPETIRVPAGSFEVEVRTATSKNGFRRTFYVEKQFPRRLIMWETSEGEKAQLLGSDRLKYWEMNDEGGEQALSRLGFQPNKYGVAVEPKVP